MITRERAAAKYQIPWVALSDSSLNGRYKSCARKFELNKLYGHARPEQEGSLAADSGKALHAAWQTWMATQDKDAAIWALMKDFPIHLQRSENDDRGLQACYSAFEEMLANPIDSRYKLAYVSHNGESKPAVEVPFRITFRDLSLFPDRDVPIYYDGWIDAILWDTLDQCYVVVDIKTTRKSRADYTAMFGKDQQCLPYAYVLEKALGQPANSLQVIYFVVYIDALNPRALKYPFNKSAQDIREWAFSAAFDINNIRMMAELGLFPKNGKACDVFSPCQYTEVCSYTEPDAIRNYLEMQYGLMDWDKAANEFEPWFELSLKVQGLS